MLFDEIKLNTKNIIGENVNNYVLDLSTNAIMQYAKIILGDDFYKFDINFILVEFCFKKYCQLINEFDFGSYKIGDFSFTNSDIKSDIYIELYKVLKRFKKIRW